VNVTPGAPATTTATLARIRFALIVGGFAAAAVGQVIGSEAVIYGGVVLVVLGLVMRIVINIRVNRALAQQYAGAPATPERVALKRQIDGLLKVQLGLLAVGLPLVALDLTLRWPQKVGVACFLVPLAGMIAGAHRQSLLNRYYALAQRGP
jgi:hypothetical protein